MTAVFAACPVFGELFECGVLTWFIASGSLERIDCVWLDRASFNSDTNSSKGLN